MKHNLEIVEEYILSTEDRLTKLEADYKYLWRCWLSMMGALCAMGAIVVVAVFMFKGIL